MQQLLLAFAFALSVASSQAQNQLTAQEVVPPWLSPFGYGSNMGVFAPHYYDKEIAGLLRGTPDGATPGVGVNTLRPGLFEYFLDYFGYDIRLEHFNYYKTIGVQDPVAIIGFPSEAHRDPTQYCPGQRSELFKNLYEPIWDHGENGTPVNENNPYALYCWKMGNKYNGLIRIWEVWNEPDAVFSFTSAWKEPGMAGNWWENAPDPCEYTLRAPIYHYIRMLRISYEVLKAVNPRCRVAPGGLGWPSFLDLLCRFSDNPEGGGISDQYPRTGAAYFDCMSFHSYPHIDNSMRVWDNSIGGFRYFRHSDAAVDGLWRLRDKFKTVLNKYGYNGTKYPEKLWINTEYGLPRKEFGDYIGSNEAQCNFVIKTLVTAQINGMAQMHYYTTADEAPEGQSNSEFAYMGFFKNLNNAVPYQGERNPVAYAHKTTYDLLAGKTFDATRTERLNLPPSVRGAAFRDEKGRYTYVLWAVTSQDKSEVASATYAFPSFLGYTVLEQRPWNFSQTKFQQVVTANQIHLGGSPVFLTPPAGTHPLLKEMHRASAQVFPNPLLHGQATLSFEMAEEGAATAQVFDSNGRLVQTLLDHVTFAPGTQQYPLDLSGLPDGAYFVRFTTQEEHWTAPIIK